MASQIASNMSDEDKQAIENMDMEKMISHVTKNVFQMMNGSGSPALSELLGGIKQEPLPKTDYLPKTRDICFDLNVDLVDFYTSKKKKINIKRKRIIEVDGKQKVVEEKKKIVIPIEKGMKDEQQIRFEGEADQIPGYAPGDIIITLIENEHPVFQRDNDNLILIKNVNLYQIYEYTFDITHLDNRVIRISKTTNDALHLNDSLRKVSGQGMPIYKNENVFGDLFIRFNVIIPKSIENGTLKKLKEIFDDSTETLSESVTGQFLLENVSETDLEEFTESDTDSEESETDSDLSSESSVSSESSGEPVRRRRR
jgi:DnaJ-class molecular chaperone